MIPLESAREGAGTGKLSVRALGLVCQIHELCRKGSIAKRCSFGSEFTVTKSIEIDSLLCIKNCFSQWQHWFFLKMVTVSLGIKTLTVDVFPIS